MLLFVKFSFLFRFLNILANQQIMSTVSLTTGMNEEQMKNHMQIVMEHAICHDEDEPLPPHVVAFIKSSPYYTLESTAHTP
jgi:hypothetical protein